MMRCFLLLAFTLLLFGCISVEQTIRLTESNSLVVGYVYVYETDAEPALIAGIEEMKGLSWRFYDEAKVREDIAKRKLEFVRYRKTRKGGRTQVDISMISRDVSKSLKEGVFPGLELTRGKVSSLSLQMPQGKLTKETVERLKKLSPECHLSLTMVVPGAIVDTNGKKLSSNMAFWEYAVGDAIVAPRVSWKEE